MCVRFALEKNNVSGFCSRRAFEFLVFIIVTSCLILFYFIFFFSPSFVIGREKPGEQSEVAQLIQQTLEQEKWQRDMMEQRYKQYMDDDEEVGGARTDGPKQNAFHSDGP